MNKLIKLTVTFLLSTFIASNGFAQKANRVESAQDGDFTPLLVKGSYIEMNTKNSEPIKLSAKATHYARKFDEGSPNIHKCYIQFDKSMAGKKIELDKTTGGDSTVPRRFKVTDISATANSLLCSVGYGSQQGKVTSGKTEVEIPMSAVNSGIAFVSAFLQQLKKNPEVAHLKDLNLLDHKSYCTLRSTVEIKLFDNSQTPVVQSMICESLETRIPVANLADKIAFETKSQGKLIGTTNSYGSISLIAEGLGLENESYTFHSPQAEEVKVVNELKKVKSKKECHGDAC